MKETAGDRSTFPALPGLPATAGAVDPGIPESATEKARGRPMAAPLITILYGPAPGAYFSGAGAGRPNFQLARSVTMSEVTSARFAGCERSITPI